jgi:diadenosine tetraphosphate (Ap4A) HIT family hydrolase
MMLPLPHQNRTIWKADEPACHIATYQAGRTISVLSFSPLWKGGSLMSTDEYDDGCKGCIRSQDRDNVPGGIIEMPGHWVLNHYAGLEGFLGWMALQPKYHRMTFAQLTDEELKTLGSNLRTIDTLLTEYWQENFKNDPVERVYVVYFFESVFDEPSSKFHLHIHLIPRFMSLDPLLREYPQRRTDPGYPSTINAWTMPFITSREQFPRQYRTEQANVKALMRWLRSR